MSDLTPVVGCTGCEGTAGRLGCPKHSPNVYVADPSTYVPKVLLQCPYCRMLIRLDVFKEENEL